MEGEEVVSLNTVAAAAEAAVEEATFTMEDLRMFVVMIGGPGEMRPPPRTPPIPIKAVAEVVAA
jgi:hypothetical protein